MARRWRGQRPFHEVWFVEVVLGDGVGLWVRYLLDAERGVAEVWAVVTDAAGVRAAHRTRQPIAAAAGPLFCTDDAELTRSLARGTCGPIRWELALDDRGARHRLVPRLLEWAGIGRTYAPGVADLSVQGELHVDGHRVATGHGVGVLGHLWGGRSRLRSWAWAHCNSFSHEGAVFEGISARIGAAPALTAVVLHVDGHRFGFAGLRDVARTTSRVDGDRWTFEARRGTAALSGVATLQPAHAATVAYPRPGTAPLYCTNTRFGSLRLVLRDPARGLDIDLRSDEAAFELVGENARAAPLDLPDAPLP